MNQQGRSTSHKTASGVLASAVTANSTFAVSYPARTAPEVGTSNAGDFFQGFFHRLIMNQAVLIYPKDFDISFGASSIMITNKTGATWPADAKWVAQFDEPGKRIFASDADNKGVAVNRTNRSDVLLVSLGAPITLDADGVCASQSVAAAASDSSSTVATLDGALASTNSVTGLREVVLDVPRNIVAAWTTAAVMTIIGKDEYGNAMMEKSASGTSHTGKKAFKRISSVRFSVAVTGATVGTGDVLGLPQFLPGRQHVVGELIDGKLIGDAVPIYLPFHINATDLAAGTAQQLVAPCAGRITRLQTIVQVALPASTNELGFVTVAINGTTVTNSTSSSYTTATGGNGSVGDVSSSAITDSDTSTVAAGDQIAVVPSSTWASAGALNGTIEIVPTGGGSFKSGTFVVGMTTAGGSTATSADVRGTWTPPTASDGSKVFQLLLSLPDPGNLGAAQHVGLT